MAKNVLGRNYTFPIYNQDGTSFFGLALRKSTFESVVMSLGDKITGDVYYKDNTLPITMQEYIEYKENPSDENEQAVKYFLLNPPTITKEGLVRDNSELSGMTKYSFVFYHPMCLLANLPFSDVATSSNQERYLSENKEFSWIGTPSDYIAKINKNLEGTQWVVVKSERFPQEKDNELSEVLQFNNETIADALKKGYDTWGIPFVVDAIKEGEYTYIDEHNQEIDYYSTEGGIKRFVVVVGLPSNEIYASSIDKQMNNPFVFRYGKGVGLKNNSRTPKNNKIITRISGYGSENNVPFGYPQIVWTGNQDWDYTINNDASNPLSYPIYKGIVGGQYVKLIKHPFTRKHLMPSVYVDCVNKKVNPFANDYDPTIELVDYYDAIGGDYPNKINPLSPSYESHEFDVKPELDSEREIGLVSAIPLNADLTPASAWDDTMDDDGNYLQSYFQITLPQLSFDIYACAAITEEMQINMRSGDCMGCTFNIQVDWEDYKRNFYDQDGNFVPNGTQRDLVKYPKSNNGQISVIAQKDNNTFGILLPNTYQHPNSGDNFVILGISLPIEYIRNAELRLDEMMQSYMLENNVYYYDYPLKFDEHFLATHTNILSQIKTNTIIRFDFAGNVLQLYVKQLSIKYGYGTLPQYDITLTDNIEVVLNQIGQVADDVERLGSLISILRQDYSRNVWLELAKKLSKTEDDVARGIITFMQGAVFGPANSIWGYVRNTLRNGTTIAHAWFRNLFAEIFETAIAKVTNYITGNNGRLLIQDDVTIQKANNADATLNVAEIESKNINNTDTIKTHNLVVTGLAHFFELVIDKIRAAGGAMILSPAEGFVVAAIEPEDHPYPQDPNNLYGETLDVSVLYFKAKDNNGKSVTQSWKVGDQALCRNFHSVEEMEVGQVMQNVSNKYYWALVLAVSENTVNLTINGETVACHWIKIYSAVASEVPSGIDTNSHGVPLWNDKPLWDGDPTMAAVGDEIVMLGYRGNESDATERKSAVYMSAYSALDTDLRAPFLAFYQGIDDFDLKSHRKTYMDANGSKFFGEFFALSATGNGDDLIQTVSNMMSSDILTPTEKRQLRERWDEMVSHYLSLIGLANDLNLSGNYDEYTDGKTYEDAIINVVDVFYFLYIFLSGDYRDRGINARIVPSWITDENINTNTNLSDSDLKNSWNTFANSSISDINVPTATTTLLTVHNKLWADLYANMEELSRAIDVFQMSAIDNIGSDNLLSAKEKAMLKQMFANEVAQYFELKGSLASFSGTIYKTVNGNQVAVTISDLTSALNTLGTYLNNDVSWSVGNDSTAWVYPTWINTDNNVNSTSITSSDFNQYWQAVFDARQTLATDIANARQTEIDNITANVEQPNTYVQATDPMLDANISANIKEGDYWYEPVDLYDPFTGENMPPYGGNQYYNQYVCKGSGASKYWKLLNAAQAALLDLTNRIYSAVFNSQGDGSAIQQQIDSITSIVRGIQNGGRNLLLNTDFMKATNNVPDGYSKNEGTGQVAFLLDSLDAPTGFEKSLKVTTSGVAGGLAIPPSSQRGLVLEAETEYTFSFWLKITNAGSVTAPTIQIRRGNYNVSNNSGNDEASIIHEFIPNADEWSRISYTFTTDSTHLDYPMFVTKKDNGEFRIVGLQLEKGNILTAWRKAEEDWQSQIDMNKEEIALRVTRNGLAQAGVIIDGNNSSVTLVGKKTSIQGDLDLQGLMTENVATFPFNYANPIVVNMGIFHDDTDANNVTVKSVQIQARNERLDGTNTSYPVLVALPFYDSAVWSEQSDNWASETNIGFDTDNTFSIFTDASVPDSLKRIVKYTKSGTRITITNEADQYARNWQSLLTSNDSDSYKSQSAIKIRGNCAVVCADARLIDGDNYEDPDKELIPNEITQDDAGKAKWKGGMFSCGGYLSRFIAVLPGQTLQLRSQIMTISVTQEVLVWIVENPTEFVPMNNGLSVEGVGLYNDNMPTFSPTDAYGGINDCWMGHPVLNLIESNNPLDLALGRVGTEE